MISGTLIVDQDTRQKYISKAQAWWPEAEELISSRDMFNGPSNPLNLKTHQTITCDFVEPTPEDELGGTTPKFHCLYNFNGEQIKIKVKYDQQYNSVYDWGRPNHEVYGSVVSQRMLWSLGFGSDQSVPVTVRCRNCPLEPW